MVKLIEESLVLLEREMNKYRISVIRQFQKVPEALVVGEVAAAQDGERTVIE